MEDEVPDRVADLPEPLRHRIAGRDLIVFDGECVLCSGFFRFIVKHDRAERFSFAIAQVPLGQELYAALDLPTDDFETNLIIVDGIIYRKGPAFAAAMSALGWPWRALGVLRYVPRVISEPVYNRIARNRYRIFGRHDTCLMPTPELRGRFLDRSEPRAA